MNKTLAIVGGSGLYDLTCFEKIKYHEITTPWGMPSNKIYELKKLIDSILKNPKKLIEANQKLNKFSKKLDEFLNYKNPTVFLTDLLIERNLINKKGVTRAC